MKSIVFASLVVAALMAATPAVAVQAEWERYQKVIDSMEVCHVGVTQEHVQLYQAAVAALDGAQRQPSQVSSSSQIVAARLSDAEKSSVNRESNFFGPIAPDLALANCGAGGNAGGE